MLIWFENALVKLGGVVWLHVNFVLFSGMPQSKVRGRKIGLIMGNIDSLVKNMKSSKLTGLLRLNLSYRDGRGFSYFPRA